MKEIIAVVQPARLARLRDAFRRIPDFPGMTVIRAEGSGYHPHVPVGSGIKGELTDSSKRVRLEIVASDEQAAVLVSLIHSICHTGRVGDGVLWVKPVDAFRRLRDQPPHPEGNAGSP